MLKLAQALRVVRIIPFLKNKNLTQIDTDRQFVILQEPEAAKEEPLAFQHIKDINNRLTVKFNHPDATKKTYTVTANKLMSLLELKEKIAAAIDLSLDEFLVLKGWGNYWNELNNESQLLKSYGMSGVVKVQIKKGKPTRHGEIPTKFLQFAIPNTSNEEELAKYEVLPILFELLVPEQTTIADIKKLVSENLKSQKQIEADPSLIRVRESLHRQAASVRCGFCVSVGLGSVFGGATRHCCSHLSRFSFW
jgi:hypothetical protein